MLGNTLKAMTLPKHNYKRFHARILINLYEFNLYRGGSPMNFRRQ